MKDRINNLKESVGGLANSIMDKGMTSVMAFVDAFQQGDVTSDGFVGKVEEIGVKTRELAEGALTIFKQVWEFLQPSIEAVGNSFKENLLPALQKLWEAIQPILPVIGAILVGALWLVINAVNLLVKALSFVIEVIATVINWIVAWVKYQIDATKIVIDGVKDIMAWFGRIPENVSNMVNSVVNWFRSLPGKITDALSSLWGGVTGLFTRIGENISNTMSNAWNGLKSGAASAANWVIDKINGIIRGFNRIVGIIPGVGGNTVAEIPKFARGVTNFGGGLAYVHEGEVLANLPAGTDVIPKDEVGRMGGSGQQITQINHIYNQLDMDVALRDLGYRLALT
jgi:phage-related protein